MLWYYEKDDQQNGPVSEGALLDLISRGELKPENLVWKEGMSDWARASVVLPEAFRRTASVTSGVSPSGETNCPTCGALVAADRLIPAGDSQICPACKDEYAQGLREGLRQPVRRAGARGTGGQSENSELRTMARETLAGAWGMAVLVTFLYQLLQQIAAFVPIIGTVIQWAIAGPLALGFMAYYVGLHRGESVEVGTLFNGFSRFGQGLGIYFITAVLVGLVAMAAAIPGGVMILLAYNGHPIPEESPLFIGGVFVAVIPALVAGFYMYLRYALVYYIANDYPELGVMGSIKRSVDLMQGRKGKFFALMMSFIGWHFLGLLAFGIGLLWSMTYMWAAFAAFYDDIGEEA